MSKEYLSDCTSTVNPEEWKREHSNVYCYTVYWKEHFNYSTAMWYQKPFASKKDAKTFAKKKKNKLIKLKPYILKTIVHGKYFRLDVKVEYTNDERHNFVEVIRV